KRSYGPGHEINRKLLTLWNSASFFIEYANIRGFRPNYADLSAEPRGDLQPLDRWLVARTRQLVRGATAGLRGVDGGSIDGCPCSGRSRTYAVLLLPGRLAGSPPAVREGCEADARALGSSSVPPTQRTGGERAMTGTRARRGAAPRWRRGLHVGGRVRAAPGRQGRRGSPGQGPSLRTPICA